MLFAVQVLGFFVLSLAFAKLSGTIGMVHDGYACGAHGADSCGLFTDPVGSGGAGVDEGDGGSPLVFQARALLLRSCRAHHLMYTRLRYEVANRYESFEIDSDGVEHPSEWDSEFFEFARCYAMSMRKTDANFDAIAASLDDALTGALFQYWALCGAIGVDPNNNPDDYDMS